MKLALAVLFLFLFSLPAFGKKIEVQGHRGARWSRPENTLPAFQFALDAGVDTLELDTLVTKDNQVVVAHDPALNPDICVDQRGLRLKSKIAIRSLTLKELKTFDCGSLINPRFKQQTPVPETKIPTLDEVFDLVAKAKKPVLFNVETKSDPEHPEYSPSPDEFVDLVLQVIRKHGVMKRVTLQSFDYRTLKAAKKKEPTLNLSVLVEERLTKPLVELVLENKAQILSPDFEWLTDEDVRALHAKNVRVIPWTANDPADWKKLIEMDIDGIITDNPKALIEYLNK